jgi:hypothetical protein
VTFSLITLHSRQRVVLTLFNNLSSYQRSNLRPAIVDKFVTKAGRPIFGPALLPTCSSDHEAHPQPPRYSTFEAHRISITIASQPHFGRADSSHGLFCKLRPADCVKTSSYFLLESNRDLIGFCRQSQRLTVR